MILLHVLFRSEMERIAKLKYLNKFHEAYLM
jgi:hypothetical protein